ncbi:hypothetical protein PHYPO_G00123600 [Pangasianodon hypophthalmus]|uniref:Uncharacterized protein n=1 Tax=Pangasianodon hypophthalmus TaxID=310915 RepID=A0A5N5KZK3_PANHP|nr:hypothetical protein PHYPO_G00123600 [Pangasianodon hypophthalmus]
MGFFVQTAKIMGALVIILQAILLLSSFGFTESSELLQCFNDYDTELKCSLTLAEPNSCSENQLSASVYSRLFTCHFDEIRPGACECRIQVQGFVLREIFTVNVLKGNKAWHTDNISTEASIKPRRPIITSVIQKTNGDFLITLNTTYIQKTFSESLVVELQYGIDGSNDYVTQLLRNGQTAYELVGRNLQPNSKYILRARVKSNYPPNKTFSEYSEAHVFKTPQSLQNLLKIIIPILCLILIICISSIYFWFNRILKPWWDKIPTPKFSTNFVKQVPQLLLLQTEFSSVSLDSTANHNAKKICVESSQVQGEDSHCSLSLGKGVDSAPLIYSTTAYERVDENSSEGVRFELEKGHQSANANQVYENQQSNEFSSGIKNRSYSQSNSSGSSFFNHPVFPSENVLVLPKHLDPMIQTDFEYSVWNGCTDSGNSTLIHITPPNNETAVVLGYQSIGDHDALSTCNDPITEEPFSIKKPQDVLISVHDSIIMPVEEGYQAFPSVA